MGTHLITQDEIQEAFARGWRVEAIEPTDLNVTVRAEPAALMARVNHTT